MQKKKLAGAMATPFPTMFCQCGIGEDGILKVSEDALAVMKGHKKTINSCLAGSTVICKAVNTSVMSVMLLGFGICVLGVRVRMGCQD